MNTELVKQEITNVIEQLHNRIGGKAARKQYAAAKWQIATLTELGIIDLMPAGFGHSDANAVIDAAKDSGKAVGEGDQVTTTEPSELNKLLNAKTEKPEYKSAAALREEYQAALLENTWLTGFFEASEEKPDAAKVAAEIAVMTVYTLNHELRRDWLGSDWYGYEENPEQGMFYSPFESLVHPNFQLRAAKFAYEAKN